MWKYVLPGINETVYKAALWFFIYSVLGWVVESIYMSICNKKLTNRGYIRGPICPIYGFGGIFVHIMLKGLADNIPYLFIAGSILATTLEFLTAKAMIKLFDCVWWDYSNKPFNYKGIICLESSAAWGLYTIIEVLVLKKIVFMVICKIPLRYGRLVVIFAGVYYLLAFALSTYRVKKGNIGFEENNIMQFKF